jgi:hypothetical protein
MKIGALRPSHDGNLLSRQDQHAGSIDTSGSSADGRPIARPTTQGRCHAHIRIFVPGRLAP